MHWKQKEPVVGAKHGEELRAGIASWDDGSETLFSIKYTWFDKNGRAARGGEIPIEVLEQALAFAQKHGYETRRKRTK
jgi:hypothetical protein